MEQILVATAEGADELVARIERRLSQCGLAGRGARVQVKKDRNVELLFVNAVAAAPAASAPGLCPGAGASALALAAAEAVAEHILERWESLLAVQALEAEYPYFTPAEKHRVLQAVREDMARSGADRLAEIRDRLLECLAEEPGLVVEGFLAFRLRDYLRLLERSVERAARGVLLDREYREFLGLLQRAVERAPGPAEGRRGCAGRRRRRRRATGSRPAASGPCAAAGPPAMAGRTRRTSGSRPGGRRSSRARSRGPNRSPKAAPSRPRPGGPG